jgi:hypothetical protein
MQDSSTHVESSAMPYGTAGHREDVTYQAMTIAAILTILVSLWVF